MASQTADLVNRFRHDNYTTAVGAVTKTPTEPINFLRIKNTDSTDLVQISFDGGSTFYDIQPGETFELKTFALVSYDVKASANTPAVQALYGSED